MDDFYARLKPPVAALADSDRAELRRSLFGDARPAPRPAGTLLRLSQPPVRSRRRLITVAAAALAVAGVAGLAVADRAGRPDGSGSDGTLPPATAFDPSVKVPANGVVPRPPYVLIDEPGWTLAIAYDVPCCSTPLRDVVLAPAGTFPNGPWARITATRSRDVSPSATTPPWPDSSLVDAAGVDVTVSRLDRLTSATWSVTGGASFALDGWDLSSDDVRVLAAAITYDGVTAAADRAPDGWEVVDPALVAGLYHATENTFTDGTPSVPVSTSASAGDAPLLSGRQLTVRFYYGGESALRRRVGPREGERRTVRGEQIVVSAEGGTYVRLHVLRGDWAWEVDLQDAAGVTPDEAVAIFTDLREVDRSTWEAALPAGAVTPAMRPVVAAELLEGVPVPAGFDVATFTEARATASRSTVAGDLANRVMCAWLSEREAAIATDDRSRQQAADDVLAGVAAWPLLGEAAPGDGWDDALREGQASCTSSM